jgi:hypothetical protein
MSFSNNAYKCKALRSYRQALMFFTRYPKPRGKKWEDNERPIYITGGSPNPRMYHYRMAAGPTDPATSTPTYFDLVLHGTSVIRYMAPTEDNKTVVYLTYGGWPSTMTRAFMYQHGWYYAQSHETTTGTSVAVPLNYAAKSAKWIDGRWLAKLTFDADNKLIVDESDHMHIYKRKSSTDDKAVRATLRRKMDILHDLLWFSIENEQGDLQESVHGNFTAKWKIMREFGPFTSAYSDVSLAHRVALREGKEEFLHDGVDFTPKTIEAMQALYMAAYRHSYGKKIHNDYANFSSGGKIEPPTQDDMRKVVMGYIMGMLGIKNGSEYEPLPKFILASEFPSSRAHFLRD